MDCLDILMVIECFVGLIPRLPAMGLGGSTGGCCWLLVRLSLCGCLVVFMVTECEIGEIDSYLWMVVSG